MRGRKPKPVEVKKAEGNRGKRKLPEAPKKIQQKKTTPPSWLDAEAKKEWNRLANSLYEIELLNPTFRVAFAQYCQAYSAYVTAVEQAKKVPNIIKTTNGNIIQSPAVGIVNTKANELRKAMTEMGLTPSSRTRLIGELDPVDPAEQLKDLAEKEREAREKRREKAEAAKKLLAAGGKAKK